MKVTLSWIKATDKEFKTFVENGFQKILNNIDNKNWSYCPTKFNPADLITRVEIKFYWEQIMVGRYRVFKIKEKTDVWKIKEKTDV